MRKKWVVVIVLFFTFLGFWLGTRAELEADFGWHLRVGQLMLEKGVPRIDPFSYTMPHYQFVNHEWLTDIAIAKLYQIVGLEGLFILFAFIAFLALAVQLIHLRLKWWLLPLILTASALLPFVGIRPHVLSWLFSSLLFICLRRKVYWNRIRWFLPLVIVLWVNLHGGFTLGLGIIGIITLSKCLQTRKILFIDLILFLCCFGATFLNPYHARIWGEIFTVMADPSLRWRVQEWQPAFMMANYGFLLLLPFSFLLIVRHRKQFQTIELALYIILLIAGISSMRNLPYWVLFAFPMTVRAFSLFYREVVREKLSQQRFQFLYNALLFISIGLVTLHCLSLVYTNVHPVKAESQQKTIAFLKQHPPQHNLFAEYSWGGYLIWQLPEEKVFIDGRMPSWQTKQSVQGDSTNAYADYLHIMRGDEQTAALVHKYAIDTILIERNDETDLVSFAEKIVGHDLPYPKKKQLQQQLGRLSMKVIYADQFVLIYRK